MDNAATVKAGTGWIQVKALNPFYDEMMTQVNLRGWRGADDDYVIDGNKTLRTDAIFRTVTDFLRTLGWETLKTNHALRAYAGSLVAMKYGIYDAQQFLRHSTVKVTESHYAYFVTKFKPMDAQSLPFSWAAVNKEKPMKPGTKPKPATMIMDAGLDAGSEFRQTPLDYSKPQLVTTELRN